MTISIHDMLKGVKDYDGNPYYSVRPERVSKVDTNNAIDEALDNDDEEAAQPNTTTVKDPQLAMLRE